MKILISKRAVANLGYLGLVLVYLFAAWGLVYIAIVPFIKMIIEVIK